MSGTLSRGVVETVRVFAAAMPADIGPNFGRDVVELADDWVRKETAFRLAVRAFAQYAEDTDTPSGEAVEGFAEGFLQQADVAAAAARAGL